MFPLFERRGEAHVTPGLPGDFIAETAQQAEMTSSFTMCRRMTLGFSPSAKWHETASRIIVFKSSIESACVNIE
jgi:hypothetical protein